MQKLYFGRLQQWIHAGYRIPAQKIIVRPENHRKSVTSLTLIRSKSIVVYLRRRRTEKTHQQRVGHSESYGYWMCWWRFGFSIYALAFVLEADILSTYCNKDDVRWHVWLILRDNNCQSRYCSVNHSNIHLIIVFTAQSETSNFPR